MTARLCLFVLLASLAAAPAAAQEEPVPPEPDIEAEAQDLEAAIPANSSEAQRRERLGRLFDRLATAETADDAKRYEASIDRLWNQSGSATADLLTSRAVEMVAAEDQVGALKLLDAALEAKPDFAEGWNKRATLFFLQGDYVSAMTAIRETLRHEPRHYGAWAGLGRILQQTGDERRALNAYRRALAIHPHMEGLKDEASALAIKIRGEEL